MPEQITRNWLPLVHANLISSESSHLGKAVPPWGRKSELNSSLYQVLQSLLCRKKSTRLISRNKGIHFIYLAKGLLFALASLTQLLAAGRFLVMVTAEKNDNRLQAVTHLWQARLFWKHLLCNSGLLAAPGLLRPCVNSHLTWGESWCYLQSRPGNICFCFLYVHKTSGINIMPYHLLPEIDTKTWSGWQLGADCGNQ